MNASSVDASLEDSQGSFFRLSDKSNVRVNWDNGRGIVAYCPMAKFFFKENLMAFISRQLIYKNLIWEACMRSLQWQIRITLEFAWRLKENKKICVERADCWNYWIRTDFYPVLRKNKKLEFSKISSYSVSSLCSWLCRLRETPLNAVLKGISSMCKWPKRITGVKSRNYRRCGKST
jgi:hypothetical protein